MIHPALRVATFALLSFIVGCALKPLMDPTAIRPNENRLTAGALSDNVLTVALEARMGKWQPDGDGGQVLDSLVAFAEVGKEMSTPGPLIRVPVGTTVKGVFHNPLDRPMTLFGLGKTRTPTDTVFIAAGDSTAFEFVASEPGTYVYWGRSRQDTLGIRLASEMQLNGMLIVDGAVPQPDRVIAISWYFTPGLTSPTGIGRSVMALNGRSWPHTERLAYTQDDSVRWRVANFTELDHPMHLHGFYFRVNSHLVNGVDSVYTPEQQRMAVTQIIRPFEAFDIAFMVDRPGNWVFHCHYAVHIGGMVDPETKDGVENPAAHAMHKSDVTHHMVGLVMGLTVAPKGEQAVAAKADRRIRIEQREKAGYYGKTAGMSYVVSDTEEALDPGAMSIPAPTLVLERDKRVEVMIVNKSTDHAAIHWHGIELESYPDGVPGWSGTASKTLPMILPGDSLAVAWTPPRAGSFMYHSHMMEAKQMGAGLYGPIIVLDPGETYDAATDRTFFFGTAGQVENVFAPPPALLLNGSANPGPMEFKAGTKYRFRFFNLAGDAPTVVKLERNGKPAEWRAVAKDGYPLQSSQAVMGPATLHFDPGEIYDFEFEPGQGGRYTMTFGFALPVPPVKVAMNVR